MIEYLTMIFALTVVSVLAFVFIGATIASVYDFWYQKKYKAWLALQDENTPQKPVAK